MTAVFTAGYSPPEQYETDGHHGAWTDIYALSALCYRAITGEPPMEATRRQNQLLRTQTDPLPKLVDAGITGYSPMFLEAVNWGLRVIETERPQDLDEWSHAWRGSEDVQAAVEPEGAGQNSLDLLYEAAEQGDAAAQYRLAHLYYMGEGVPKDVVEAANWCRKAADQGLAAAQCDLGALYDHGEGVPKDSCQAAIWYRKAAEQYSGEEAAFWYRKAAEQGDADAQYLIGSLYDNGEGVPKDAGEAANWYRQAAEQGHVDAQFCLGRLYFMGKGVPEDAGEAANWFRQADEQGHAGAGLWRLMVQIFRG